MTSQQSGAPGPLSLLRDWAVTIPFALTFFALLLFFDVAQRIAILFGRVAHEYIIVLLNGSLMYSLYLLGVRFEIRFSEPISGDGPYIVVANHQSLFDIPILHTIFARYRPRFIAKQELARWIPSVSFNLRHGGNAVIDRSNARQAIAEIERLGKAMNRLRFAAVIFPEGTRAREGTIKKFRYAGFASLMQTAPKAPIVPVAIDGSWRLVPQSRGPIPWGVTVHVHIGKPIERGAHESLKKLMEEVESYVRKEVAEIRGEAVDPRADETLPGDVPGQNVTSGN